MFLTLAGLVLRRVLVAIPILIVVSFMLFVALRPLPVDPAAMSVPPTATKQDIEAKRIAMGLDEASAGREPLLVHAVEQIVGSDH